MCILLLLHIEHHYTNVYCYYCSVFIEKCVYIYQVLSSLVVVPIYIPSVVYGLRMFIVVVQELHCLSTCLYDQS